MTNSSKRVPDRPAASRRFPPDAHCRSGSKSNTQSAQDPDILQDVALPLVASSDRFSADLERASRMHAGVLGMRAAGASWGNVMNGAPTRVRGRLFRLFAQRRSVLN